MEQPVNALGENINIIDDTLAKNLSIGKRFDVDIYMLIKSNASGIIGVEAATAYWGLSTFPYDIPIFLFNDDTLDNEGHEERFSSIYLFVPNVNMENTVRLSDTLCVTDREQTVCDMVRYNRHEFHLFETVMDALEDKRTDLVKLEKLARQYGIWERINEIYEEACIDFENQ